MGAGEAGEDDDEVNVKVIFEKRTVLDFDVFIPIMTNTRKLKKGELLKRLVIKDEFPEPPASKRRKIG